MYSGTFGIGKRRVKNNDIKSFYSCPVKTSPLANKDEQLSIKMDGKNWT